MLIRIVTQLPKRLVRTIKIRSQISKVGELLDISYLNLIDYFVTLVVDVKFFRYMDKKVKTAEAAADEYRFGGWIDLLSCALIYSIIREYKPEIVVETGVGAGGSSAFILKALNDNKKGILYSIDLPGNDGDVYPKLGKPFDVQVPSGWETGWLIPSWLKERHNLIIGDSRQELPKLLRQVDKVNLFLHDSLHTDEHVLMEFNAVLPHMHDKGILLCDDVHEEWSLGFVDFCQANNIPFTVVNERLGVGRLWI